MPNETIVQYILNVETGKAEKGLSGTAKAAGKTEESFDDVGKATKKMNQKLKSTEKQTKKTSSSFRNMRKAGRDLDGAFSDLGQGLGLIDPAAGQLFMTLSSGASIAEGLGRSLLLFVNPAILGVAAVTVAAAGALYFWNKSQVAAKKETERANKVISENTKILEDQKKALDAATEKMLAYTDTLAQAQMNLDLLTGAMTSLEGATARAKTTAMAFEARTLADNEKIVESLKTQIGAARELREEARKKAVLLNEEAVGNKQKKKQARDDLRLAAARVDELGRQLEAAKLNRREIKFAAEDLEKTLITHAEITQQKKEQTEQDRKNAKDRAQNARAEKERQSAAKKLQSIINKLTIGELSGREKILAQRDQELVKIRSFAEISGEIQKGIEAENALRIKTNRLLDEQIKKEQAILDQQKKEREAQIAGVIQGITGQVTAPSLGGTLKVGGEVGALVSSTIGPMIGALSGTVGSTLAAIGAEIMLVIEGIIASMALLPLAIIAAGGLLVKAVIGQLVKLGEKTPDERRKDNRDRAESLKSGLEFLPEILLQVLPEFAIAMSEALIDGLILAMRSLGDIIVNSLRSVMTKEGRRDLREQSVPLGDFLRDFFDPEKSATYAGGGAFIPQAAGGMRYTGNQRSGLAMLHQGEFVVPQSGMRPQSVDRQMSSSGGSPINIVINSPVVEQNAVDALVRRIEERFNSNFGLSSSNLFGGR